MLETEIKNHTATIDKLIAKGRVYVASEHASSNNIQSACCELENSLRDLLSNSNNRKKRLKQEHDAYQVL